MPDPIPTRIPDAIMGKVDNARMIVAEGKNTAGATFKPEAVKSILSNAKLEAEGQLKQLQPSLTETAKKGGIDTHPDEKLLGNLLHNDALVATQGYIDREHYKPLTPDAILGFPRKESNAPTLELLRKDIGITPRAEVIDTANRTPPSKDQPYCQTLDGVKGRLQGIARELGVAPSEGDMGMVYQLCQESGVDPIGNILDANNVVRETAVHLMNEGLSSEDRLKANLLLSEAQARLQANVSMVEGVYRAVATPAGRLEGIKRLLGRTEEPKVEGINLPPGETIRERKKAMGPGSQELRRLDSQYTFKVLVSGFGRPDGIPATASKPAGGLKEPSGSTGQPIRK